MHINAARPLQARARKLCAEAGADLARVTFHDHPTDDAWCRDHGPIFVKNDATKELALTDWELMERENGMLINLPTPRLLVSAQNRWNVHEILKRSNPSQQELNAKFETNPETVYTNLRLKELQAKRAS